jgi:type II secretion system protein H
MRVNDRIQRFDAGFSIIEILTVVAVMGLVAAIAAPAMVRMKNKQETRSAVVELGGMIRQARSQAMSDSVPHLVLFEKEEIIEGKRTTFALFVRDNDRTYTITAPDDVKRFELSGYPLQVRQYSEDHVLLPGVTSSSSESALDGDYMDLLGDYSQKMADGDASGNYYDVLAMYEDKAEDWAGGGSPGCSGPGPCLDPDHGDYEPQFDPGSPDYDPSAVLDLLNGTYSPSSTSEVVNGTTFPLSDVAGIPALAFTERGVPVDLDTPTAWGTGAGSVYVTDGEQVVYAASVAPLGSVRERRFDTVTNGWQ